jgi:hypothetical protein
MKTLLHLLLPLFAFAACTTAVAGARTLHADWDKVAKPAAGARIVLIEPDMELSEVTAGGRNEPRADWSRTAKRLYPVELRRVLEERGYRLADDYEVPAELPPDARIRQLIELHQAVGISIWQHHFTAMKLATKGRDLDFTLGDGVRELEAATGADYALFTYVRDSYTSGGRAAMMVFGALLGVAMNGGVQVGFTSLVDLHSGQVLWFDFLVDQTGDLRDAKGVHDTVADLTRDFPK